MGDTRLSDDAVASRLPSAPSWSVVDGKLHRELKFADFRAAMAFMVRVAFDAERLNHHPDWSNVWNRVVIDIASHDAGGITERCFELAEAIDAAALSATAD